jgi:hypothetical protein
MSSGGIILLASKGGPPVVAMIVIALVGVCLFSISLITYFLAQRRADLRVSTIFGKRGEIEPSPSALAGDPDLEPFGILLDRWPNGSSMQAYEAFLHEALERVATRSLKDRIVPIILTLIAALTLVLALVGWSGKVHPGDFVGHDPYEMFKTSDQTLEEFIGELSAGLIAGSAGLIFLNFLITITGASWIVSLLRGPRTQLPRLQWRAASILELRDPSNEGFWSTRRKAVEDRWGRQWSWAAYYSGPLWLIAKGFSKTGGLILLVYGISYLAVPALRIVAVLIQFYLAMRGNSRLVRSRRRRNVPLF